MEILNSKNEQGHNIDGEIKLLLYNIPDDLNEIEKLRWLYIRIGELFNYDYRIASDIEIGNKKVNFDYGYICNYQTCSQICEIMNNVYSKIGIQSRTVKRKTQNRLYELEHVANEVTLSTGERYILDLTVDLYLIQSGCQTHEFGSYGEDDYDTISESKLEAIDEKLHLIKYGEYTDKKIRDKKSVINGIDYSSMTYDEELIFKIEKIKELIPNFTGYNEGRLFVDKLLNDFGIQFHKFNLIYKNDDKNKLIGCFQIYGDENIWYLYAGNSGLIKTDARKLNNMLINTWYCKNERLEEIIQDELNNKSMHV